ncbi:MAG: hypothetical protein GXO75_08340 [Calditrichaeota bacterium]|nr:hypothetical protein [Calditrichota bacterium]
MKPPRVRHECYRCGDIAPGYWSPLGWRCMTCLREMKFDADYLGLVRGKVSLPKSRKKYYGEKCACGKLVEVRGMCKRCYNRFIKNRENKHDMSHL